MKTPKLSKKLSKRINMVRRDIGNLLFHFTRKPKNDDMIYVTQGNGSMGMPSSAFSVLRKILYESRLKGTSKWSPGQKCVCFTEAPITEFNSIFSLVDIASSKKEEPRYEPYGIAVSKQWFFQKGGRPVIYDSSEKLKCYPQDMKYRFVPYDPIKGIDYTWEREWRINSDYLSLDPKHTFVIVPTADEAFEIVYEFANLEPDVDFADGESYVSGVYHTPHWLAVSLDLFGFKIYNKDS